MVLTISHKQCESNDDNPRWIERTIWIIAYRAIAFFVLCVLCVLCATIWIPLCVRIKDEKQKDNNQRGMNIITGFLYYIMNSTIWPSLFLLKSIWHDDAMSDVRSNIHRYKMSSLYERQKRKLKLKICVLVGNRSDAHLFCYISFTWAHFVILKRLIVTEVYGCTLPM